jgi:hypothetical protein
MADSPDVAAAQIEVPSTPTQSENIAVNREPTCCFFTSALISDTGVPYALSKAGVFERSGPNRIESLRAVSL